MFLDNYTDNEKSLTFECFENIHFQTDFKIKLQKSILSSPRFNSQYAEKRDQMKFDNEFGAYDDLLNFSHNRVLDNDFAFIPMDFDKQPNDYDSLFMSHETPNFIREKQQSLDQHQWSAGNPMMKFIGSAEQFMSPTTQADSEQSLKHSS